MIKGKILKTYSVATGRRFAAVEFETGHRVDVCTRGPRKGRETNLWGDLYPIEETRAREIKQKALDKLYESQLICKRTKGESNG